MMNKVSKTLLMGGTGILVLLFLSHVIKFPLLTFEIKDHLLWSTNKHFAIKWIHSVEKEEWVEFYEIKEEALLLTKTKFKTFGAGVPSTPKESKQAALIDGFVELEINRSFPSIQLVVSENVKSTLIIDDKEILLYELAGDYEPVTISIQTISLWDMLLKGECL